MDQELQDAYHRAQLELSYLPELATQLTLRGLELPAIGPWLHWVCSFCEQHLEYDRYPQHHCIDEDQYRLGIRQFLNVAVSNKRRALDKCLQKIFQIRTNLGPTTTKEQLVADVRASIAPSFGITNLTQLVEEVLQTMDPTLSICADLRLLVPLNRYPIRPFRFAEILDEANVLHYFQPGGRFFPQKADDVHRNQHILDSWVGRESAGGLYESFYPCQIISAGQINDPYASIGSRWLPENPESWRNAFHIKWASAVVSNIETNDINKIELAILG